VYISVLPVQILWVEDPSHIQCTKSQLTDHTQQQKQTAEKNVTTVTQSKPIYLGPAVHNHCLNGILSPYSKRDV
jgi:hypothetical protein